MENEIWKDIPGYAGTYQVSNFGRVKSLRKVLKAGLRFIKSYPNAQIASKETHIPQSNINRCVNNKLKSAGGYLWKKI